VELVDADRVKESEPEVAEEEEVEETGELNNGEDDEEEDDEETARVRELKVGMSRGN